MTTAIMGGIANGILCARFTFLPSVLKRASAALTLSAASRTLGEIFEGSIRSRFNTCYHSRVLQNWETPTTVLWLGSAGSTLHGRDH